MASRKNQVSDMFFKIGFMSYSLFSNSPLSRNRGRNYERAYVVLNQRKEKCYNSISFQYFPRVTTYLHFLKNNFRKIYITPLFSSNILEKRYNSSFSIRETARRFLFL